MMLLALLLAAASAGAETVKIAVYHTNDVHGWIHPKPATWYAKDPKRPIGGFAAAARVLQGETLPKLLLDGGDWFQGTPEAALSSGTAVVDCFNALGYDAVVVGNHDLDYGQPQLETLARRLKPTVLGSNIYRAEDDTRPDYVTPWLIKDVAGVKVGIFGLLTTNMRELSFEENIAGLRFRREADEARDMVRRLKAEGATVIIAVTHVGFMEPGMRVFEDDKFIAGEVPGIDLIVGGHTHSRVTGPVKDPRHGTLLVQAGSYLSQLGRVELSVDRETGKVVESSGRLIDLWIDEVGEDPEVKRLVARYQEDADKRLSVVVATAASTLARNRNGEAAIGSWFTDCTRAWGRTDVALQNSGGIRSDLPAGPVPVRRMWEIMPFDNHIATLSLTGAQLRETLERGVSGATGVLQVSGLSLRYKRSAEPGKRLVEVRINGRPVKDEARYTVTTADFLVQRGDGYATLGQGEGTMLTDVLMRDVLVDCAKRAKLIEPPEGGRIVAED
ncbi:MAG: bifunctional metallophosphatase/5'-nucleotidase [Elusimicrobia bacterium]|nr:bifunctional metallophosphatase/5'-nucleotidase [Elusimicrobiota bacterium]